MAKGFSTIRELRNFKKKSFGQQRFLYPLLFQDSFYGIAYNRFVNESKYWRKKDYRRNNNEFNFIKLKRLIKKSRESDFYWVFSNQFIDKFQIFQEILIIIFDWVFSYRLESFIKKPKNWNSYQSLHSIFPFLEDNIYNSNTCLEITIPYSFHPETFIRIFRQHVQDILFIHLLRLFLYQNKNCIILKPFFYVKKNQFHNLLWNFYLYKFECSLNFIWKKIYNFESISFWFFLNQTNFGQKIKNISKQSNFIKIEKNNNIEKNISIHYMRYSNRSILITNGNVKMFGKNWTIFLILFWEKYFHFWFEPNRIFTKDLSKNFICFLGYIFRSKNKPTLTKIQVIDYTINTNLITKEFCISTPRIYLIRILAKEKFCDNMGRPICKLPWTTLADYEIFKRFDEITKTIFFYYSGSLKKKDLYQLQYILRFSCAKTLACKHKSTIRNVWKRYGSNFITHSIFLRRIQSNFSNFWQINSHEHKIWYLSITQINYLVNLFQKLKNVQNL
uniref:Maturase K n=1 Tax=Cheilolejeunea xanthocarpa TaxID=414193 RepID=A0A4Y5P534_9MARC|nr:maturase K [Cheilolejeunea xanthocarpa]QCW58400.1 maturase K [Cheilolejeunea xanthocarpa]